MLVVSLDKSGARLAEIRRALALDRQARYKAPRLALAETRAQARTGAGLAQLVEHLICNQGVGGSNPSAGTNEIKAITRIDQVYGWCIGTGNRR